ncbi:N-6 DNA methylase [Streptomyces sp. NPDC002132]|uniref:N-6 DNA methylase n=1 Tax=unclassified Streptomyces TaxID=2593676 RepID=UPI0033277EAC
MSDVGDALVSRSDIARMAGVRRPAVTNWERRHPDFPRPVAPDAGSTEPEAFRAAQVLDWLSGRTIPSNALQPGEPAGTTYGDRFRSALRGGRSGGLLSVVEQLARREADRLRGRLHMPDYLNLLLSLVFVQSQDEERWARYLKDPGAALRDLELPEEYGQLPLSDVVRLLEHNPPASRDESRQAFDRLLALLRDTDARTAGEFFTPPSVSRVMARSLAGQASPAKRLHDPFCRSGELLAGYLDVVAEQGGTAPEEISGRAPHKGASRLTLMNLQLRGVDRPVVRPGFFTPSLGPVDPPGSFDAVIANPPFAVRIDNATSPPGYWRYGVTRSGDFDWLQYVVSRLAPGGRAAVLMPSGPGFRSGAEGRARARMVEDGVVECVMALPPQLFGLTRIQTQVWFLRPSLGRREEVLFVDGAGLGHMAGPNRRVLSDSEIDRLVRAYVSWRQAREAGRDHAGTPGLSRAVDPEAIAALDYRLDPPLLVHGDAPMESAVDPDAVKDRLAELSDELSRLGAQAQAVDSALEERLRRYGL